MRNVWECTDYLNYCYIKSSMILLHANAKGADQSVQSRYLISSFIIRSLKHDCQTCHLHSLNIRAYL